MQFEGFDRPRRRPRRWRGVVLQAEPLDDDDDDVLWVHELIGADGRRSPTAPRSAPSPRCEANPASDLLVLDPARWCRWCSSPTHAPGRVTIDPPDGLFEL